MTKAANKRKRKVGQGMKPRLATDAKEPSLSADAGQTQVVSEAQTGVEVGTQTGDTLEAEKVQNLESPQEVENPLSVAQVDQGEAPEVVTTNLEDLMRDSVDARGPQRCCELDTNGDGNCNIHSAPGEFRKVQNVITSIAEIEDVINRRGSENVRLEPNGEVIVMPMLGQQEDGTFKMVVTVREGIIEPLRQQAEADRQTPEEWLSERLGDYLDNWWSPAASR